jgi:hypothetical protein
VRGTGFRIVHFPFFIPDMPDPAPNVDLLRSLGRLARGLSALFWGLPVALIVCVQTAMAGWFRSFGVVPPLAVTGLLLYGLWQMGRFQKQERPWRAALERAKLLALINCGLCPFLYWWNKMPANFFFTVSVAVLALSALLFLFNLNLVLERLGAMLPDETLRHETKYYTALNRNLLVALIMLAACFWFLKEMPNLPPQLDFMVLWLKESSQWVLVFPALLPLAMTMALIWKTKEVILGSVFGPE